MTSGNPPSWEKKIPPLPEHERPFIYALSGGVDSVSLLHWLVLKGFRPLVAHYNHRWLPREDQDAEFCRAWAEAARLPFCMSQARKGSKATEQKAREERYRFFSSLAQKHSIDTLVTAHTASDQAETVLMRLIRGSGSRGLGAIRPISTRDGMRILRPWLGLTRSEILAYAKKHQLKWREDPINRDTNRLRALMRHRILPYLKKTTRKPVESALVRAAELLATEDDYLTEQASQALQMARDRSRPERLVIPVLQEMHTSIQRRVIQAWLETSGVRNISWDDIENVRHLLEGGAEHQTNLSQNKQVRRREKRLLILPV